MWYAFTMYQAFVLGLGVLLLFGVGYFIKSTDQTGIVTSNLTTQSHQASSSSSTEAQGKPLLETIQGTYVCDTDSRCANPRILVIAENGELNMTTSFDNGVEILEEIGTWTADAKGNVSLIITGTNSEIYPTPYILSARLVSSSTLLGVKTEGNLYKDWVNPLFRKRQASEE